MTGGVAQSVDAGTYFNNVTPVVIGGSLTTGSIGNAGIDQSVSSQAEGGNFGLSMDGSVIKPPGTASASSDFI